MSIGQYRHLVTIRWPEPGTADSFGHRTEAWPRERQVYAKVEPFSGTEGVENQQPTWKTKYRVTTREHVDGLNRDCRVVLADGSVLHIEEAKDADDAGRRGVQWQLVCIERG